MLKCRGASYFSVHSPAEFKRRLDEEFEFMVAPLVSEHASLGGLGWAQLRPCLERKPRASSLQALAGL